MNFKFDLLERMKLQNELAGVWSQMSLRADTITDHKIKAEIEKKVKILMEVDTYLCYLEQALHTEKKARQIAELKALKVEERSSKALIELETLKQNIHEGI